MALIKLRNLADPSRTVTVSDRVYAIESKRKNKDGQSASQFKDWEVVPMDADAEPVATEEKPAKAKAKK